MPVERIAVSSLVLDILPIATSTPNSSDIGMVSTTMLGRLASTSLPTISAGTPRRMIISAERKRNCTSNSMV